VPRNDLVEGIVYIARTFSRMRTYDLGSGDDGALCNVSLLKVPLVENLDFGCSL
jgi:hypothetical protein